MIAGPATSLAALTISSAALDSFLAAPSSSLAALATFFLV